MFLIIVKNFKIYPFSNASSSGLTLEKWHGISLKYIGHVMSFKILEAKKRLD
jgi:hypothetical protein